MNNTVSKVLIFVFVVFGIIGFVSNKVYSQTSSPSVIDTVTINLSGSALGSTSALNITVGVTGGVAKLKTGVTFMANGASQLLTDVNSTTNLITVVWSGSITDGKATITAKLDPASISGSPVISAIKVEAAGGKDITSSVVTSVTTSSSTAIATPTPTPTSTPTPSPTPSPTPEDVLVPTVDVSASSNTIKVKSRGINAVKLLIKGVDFDSTARCTITSSDNSILRIRPTKILLSPARPKKVVIAKVPISTVRSIIRNDSSELVIVSVTCNNDAEGELDLVVEPGE